MKILPLIIVLVISGCTSKGYRPMTYLLWTNELTENKKNLVDITKLSEDDILILREQNPKARFYYATGDKRYMEPVGTPNYKGFFEKVLYTPVTVVVDGITITIYAILSGGIHGT